MDKLEAKASEKNKRTEMAEQKHFVEMYSNNHDVVTKPMHYVLNTAQFQPETAQCHN